MVFFVDAEGRGCAVVDGVGHGVYYFHCFEVDGQDSVFVGCGEED